MLFSRNWISPSEGHDESSKDRWGGESERERERESYLYIRKAQADQQLAPGDWTWPGGIKL